MVIYIHVIVNWDPTLPDIGHHKSLSITANLHWPFLYQLTILDIRFVNPQVDFSSQCGLIGTIIRHYHPGLADEPLLIVINEPV